MTTTSGTEASLLPPPTYGGGTLERLEDQPKKIMKIILAGTIITAAALLYGYTATRDKNLLLALLVVLATLPMDVALIYGLAVSYYRRLREFIYEVLGLLEPEAYGVLYKGGYILVSARLRSGETLLLAIPKTSYMYLEIIRTLSPRRSKPADSVSEIVRLGIHFSRIIGFSKGWLGLRRGRGKCDRVEKELKGEVRVLDPYRPVINYGVGEGVLVYIFCPRGVDSSIDEIKRVLEEYLPDRKSSGFP
ncbi:MAG: hypothetical protein GSR73_05035 [Desulfurococcales archaeon]|nr:hypothetical protein [Desulfurococcales archaeon]